MQDPRQLVGSSHCVGPHDYHSMVVNSHAFESTRDSEYNQDQFSSNDARYNQNQSLSSQGASSYSSQHLPAGQSYLSQQSRQSRQHSDARCAPNPRHACANTSSHYESVQDPRVCVHSSRDTSQLVQHFDPDTTAYTTSPRPEMQLISSHIEKPPEHNSRVATMQQNRQGRSQSPPPAYTSEALLPHQSRSSYSSGSSSSFIPDPMPLQLAGPMGQLADGYKVVAIPATSAALGSPFLRAYPPALEGYGISRDAFLQFLDRLNRAAVASPPIQVLGLAGNIVSMVPLHTAQIVGSVVDLAAQASTVAISKGRTELLLREVNAGLFKDAGLRAQVAKLDVVARLTGMPILNAEGKVDKKSSILVPLRDDEDMRLINAQERRIRALSPWISPLRVDALPAVDGQTNMFGKMHAAVSERQRKKEEGKMMKDRKKMSKGYTRRDEEEAKYEEQMEDYLARESKIREKDGRRMDKELRELEKKRERAAKEHDKELHKIEKHRRKDDKEEGSIRKILFLIIQKV